MHTHAPVVLLLRTLTRTRARAQAMRSAVPRPERPPGDISKSADLARRGGAVSERTTEGEGVVYTYNLYTSNSVTYIYYGVEKNIMGLRIVIIGC